MAGFFVLGTLAAFGFLSLIWTLLGWLLPRERDCAVVFWRPPEPEILAKFKWLESLGLLHCPVILLPGGEQALWKNTENCNEEDLLSLTRQAWKEHDGTGTGDTSGRGQCRGVPEL